ncbi:carbohydrate ABC transporter permease [Cohnella silvisoli]|uniref:Carbohydrate ABC transporter permease n=1 Tax=Cohnella silvisoli TaxID=2873699 RepID=A0ABV1KSG6_9BACL|nr:carbohydrate ABC transporter permease [Cohnella silvisoli]MCD9022427.1 carbohydrate ABC transporter permease [Cohnella silvisoli]
MNEASVGKKISRAGIRMILIVFAATVILPFLWLIYSSFKTSREFMENPLNLPKQLYFDNYVHAWVQANMGSYFINSILISVVSLACTLLISVTSAYAITRFVNAYTKFLKGLYISTFFLPGIVGLVPLFLMMNDMHLINNRFGMIIVYIALNISFSVFVLSGFVSNIAKDYEEAAFIDGASRYGILFKVIIPLSMPAIVTVSVFVFLGLWNEFLYAYTFLTDEAIMTIPIGLNNLFAVQKYQTDWGALFAGLVMVLIPTLLFYALVQKHITSGIAAGGIKM